MRKQLSPLEQWAVNQKVGDIPGLMTRSMLKLNPEEGYACWIDGIKITVGQSPSEAKRKTRRILERLIKTPGSSKPVENNISLAQIEQAVTAVVKSFQKPNSSMPRPFARRSSNR